MAAQNIEKEPQLNQPESVDRDEVEDEVGDEDEPYVIVVTGDRCYSDVDLISEVLGIYRKKYPKLEIIQGGATGVDTIALTYAQHFKIPCQSFKANWKMWGRAAGPLRNQEMLDDGNPSLVLAFHNNISKSKGTKDMIKRCVDRHVLVLLIDNTRKLVPVTKLNVKEICGS